MRKIAFPTIIFLLLCLFVIGCSDNSDNSIVTKENSDTGRTKVKIANTEFGFKSYGSPFVIITVKNVSSDTVYNVACNVNAKDSSNKIVDSGFAYFANGGKIVPNESAEAEAIFFKLKTFTGYDLKYEVTWLDVK
jgi:hypothetical protein